jgi:hypothetical protein
MPVLDCRLFKCDPLALKFDQPVPAVLTSLLLMRRLEVKIVQCMETAHIQGSWAHNPAVVGASRSETFDSLNRRASTGVGLPHMLCRKKRF